MILNGRDRLSQKVHSNQVVVILLPPVHAVLLSALTDSDIRTLGFSRYRY